MALQVIFNSTVADTLSPLARKERISLMSALSSQKTLFWCELYTLKQRECLEILMNTLKDGVIRIQENLARTNGGSIHQEHVIYNAA